MLSSRFHGLSLTSPAALCAFLSLVSPCSAFPQTAEEAASHHFAAAHAAQDSGDLEQAAREYLEVTRLLPETAEGYASLGMVYNAQGKFAESARALAKAKKLKPDLPGVSLYLGVDYEQQHQYALALPPLVEAVRQDATSKDANVWLGRALWGAGRTQQSLVQLRKSTVLFPQDAALLLESGEAYHKAAEEGIARVLETAHGTPLAHQIYGDIYKEERAWTNAAAHYYRALELDPQWAGGHFGLGEIALRQEKFDTAAEQYQQELKTNPHSASSLARLGELAMLSGKAQDALPWLTQAMQVSGYEAAYALGLPRAYPPNAEDLSEQQQQQLKLCLAPLEAAPTSAARSAGLAVIQQRLGNRQEFALAWEEFTKQVPSPAVHNAWERGQADFYQQDFEAATKHLDGWRTLHPADLKAQYLLATAYRNLSLKTLEELLKVAPDSYPAHILLAETYQNAEQDAKALEEFRAAAAMAPEVSGVHFSIGHLLAKGGQQEQAQKEFATELRLNPQHPEANAEMGTILLQQQQTAEAIPYFEEALKSNPDLWSTYSELGKAYYAQKNYAKAEAALLRAVRHDPQGLARYQLGLVYRSMGQKEAANAQFEISRKLKLEALTQDETKMNKLHDLPQ